MENDILTQFDDDATLFTCLGNDESTLFENQKNDLTEDISYCPLTVGSTFLDKYTILEVLGSGNFGIIYRIKPSSGLDISLVVKEFFPKGFVTRDKNNHLVLKSSLSVQEKKNFKFMQETFIGEAKNLVKVTEKSHPNIVTIFSLEENVNNTTYFLMNHERGVSLKEYINQRKKETNKTLTNDEIYKIARPLLSGLKQIHSVDVYHQDIKLENILIREDGSPLLLDFGASTILHDTQTDKYLNAATPRYAAIEQINLDNPPKIDQRTDIYAMGVLLYKLITDTFPPKAKDRLDVMNKGGKDPYISLRNQKLKNFDKHLLSAVDKALQISQDNRFENAQAFIEALKNTKKIKKYIFLGLAVLGLGSYFSIPESTGSIQLRGLDKGVTIKIDGKNVKVAKNNILSLGVGKHKLEIIKSGHESMQKNITITRSSTKNLEAKLIPSEHEVRIKISPDNAKLEINGKPNNGNTSFHATHKVEEYRIKISAKNHETKVIETTYNKLFERDYNLENIQLIKTSVDVSVIIDNPFNMGATLIHVNNKPISRENTFVAKKDKKYKIRIINPYYKEIKRTLSYDTLKKHGKVHYTLERDKVNYILSTDPDGANVVFYERRKGHNHKIFPRPKIIHGETIFELPTSNALYATISKNGYSNLENRPFTLRNDVPIERKHVKLALEKEKSVVSTKPYVHKMIAIKGQSFSISKFEVNHEAFASFLSSEKLDKKNKDAQGHMLYHPNILTHFEIKEGGYVVKRSYKGYPITQITWYGARAYVAWLSKMTTGKPYRLPTSAQWESAARKGFNVKNLDAEANYDNSYNTMAFVSRGGSKKENSSGIYDLFGNVFEWTDTKASTGKHVITGGSFRSKKSFLLPSKRSEEYDKHYNRVDLGFRVIRK